MAYTVDICVTSLRHQILGGFWKIGSWATTILYLIMTEEVTKKNVCVLFIPIQKKKESKLH